MKAHCQKYSTREQVVSNLIRLSSSFRSVTLSTYQKHFSRKHIGRYLLHVQQFVRNLLRGRTFYIANSLLGVGIFLSICQTQAHCQKSAVRKHAVRNLLYVNTQNCARFVRIVKKLLHSNTALQICVDVSKPVSHQTAVQCSN